MRFTPNLTIPTARSERPSDAVAHVKLGICSTVPICTFMSSIRGMWDLANWLKVSHRRDVPSCLPSLLVIKSLPSLSTGQTL